MKLIDPLVSSTAQWTSSSDAIDCFLASAATSSTVERLECAELPPADDAGQEEDEGKGDSAQREVRSACS
jgi:hypothetical protein